MLCPYLSSLSTWEILGPFFAPLSYSSVALSWWCLLCIVLPVYYFIPTAFILCGHLLNASASICLHTFVLKACKAFKTLAIQIPFYPSFLCLLMHVLCFHYASSWTGLFWCYFLGTIHRTYFYHNYMIYIIKDFSSSFLLAVNQDISFSCSCFPKLSWNASFSYDNLSYLPIFTNLHAVYLTREF